MGDGGGDEGIAEEMIENEGKIEENVTDELPSPVTDTPSTANSDASSSLSRKKKKKRSKKR